MAVERRARGLEAVRGFAAAALVRDLAVEAPERDLEAAALLRDLEADALVPDLEADLLVPDLEADVLVPDLEAEALVPDLVRALPALRPLVPLAFARVRAALRADAERLAAFWPRVRAALRAAVLRSPLSVWVLSSCTRPSRRSTASRSGFGACLPSDTWAGSSESSRATLFRIP